MTKNNNNKKININEEIIKYLADYDKFLNKISFSISRKCPKLEIEDIKQQLILLLLMHAKSYNCEKDNGLISTYFSQIVINSANNILRRYWQIKNRVYIESVSLDNYLNKSHSDETKQKISESMKLAQKEGRAHNIGECRWNNTHSWPEKWLIQVLKNECCYVEGIHYVTEYPFHRFSLDFAFVNSKLCIEVDGKQHTTDKAQIERDKRKDELLREDGWKELRIPWRECFSNPKTWIDKIKSFLREYNTMASIGDS